MTPQDRVQSLVAADEDYTQAVSASYDEVIHEVAARAEATGSLGKLDIAP